MITSAVTTEPSPSRLDTATKAAWALPSRLVAIFSGPVGLALKIVLLAVVNAVAIWAASVLAADSKWIAVGVLAATTVALDLIYLWPKRAIPLKFLIPGTLFLIGFQLIPIAYTVNVAFTNYSTGHIATKDEAIAGIKRNSLAETADAKSYLMAPARDIDGKLTLILVDEETGATFAGTRDRLEQIPRAAVRIEDGAIAAAAGYRLVQGNELFQLDQQLSAFTVPTDGTSAIRAQGLSAALELKPTLRYDESADTFVDLETGAVFRDNGRGSFVAANRTELEPGWRTGVGFGNFRRIVEDPLIRAPFLRVFAWTFAFASITVLISFSLGLFLAIALDKPGMRFQRVYRTTLVIPFAIPGFLSLLIWRGLLNDDFGVVNGLLHLNVPWLFDANWAKLSVILVSLWLTFPYFFLVSLGALQAIPTELVEAARVDGGGRWQIFRRVTLPLLLVVVAPLLIASFAFNFNNFNNIYLLTGGGPAANDQAIAGSTDILISYTYKLAIEAGKGQDYGLASAITMVIFFLVATMSALIFWRSKSLENVR